jgi:murein tripeptide amidase MpaA
MNFLMSNRLEAEALREEFEFRIVPMVNVDGVISGNYRTNISGNDVNRQWIFPSKALHPEIYYLKQ